MWRRPLGIVTAIVVLVGGAACSEDRRSPTAAELDGVDLRPDHVIEVDGSGFEPPEVTVVAGDVLRLVNTGRGPHSFSAGERLETGAMQPGEAITVLLERPGEVEYVDRAGGTGNEGRIVVVPAGR